MNNNILKAKILKTNKTRSEICKLFDISESEMEKISNNQLDELKMKTVNALISWLKLDCKTTKEIFF